MAWLEQRVTRTSQPQELVGIDWTNPLVSRFGFLMMPALGDVNLINRDVITRTGTFVSAASKGGVGPNFVGTTADRLGEYGKNSGNVVMADANAGLTMFAVVVPNSVSVQQSLASLNRSAGWNTRARLEISATGTVVYVNRHVANGTAAIVSGTTIMSVGMPYVIVGTSVTQSLHNVYLNGVLEAQSATSLTAGASDWDSLFVGLDGVSNPGYALPANSTILMIGAARGALSDAEIKSLSDNPWQLFEPEVEYVWVEIKLFPTFVQPVGTVSTGSWTPTGAATLYGAINEVTPSDAEYISVTGANTCEMILEQAQYPGTANQVLSYYASSTNGSMITITLKQGTTTIMSRTHALTATNTLYNQTLTAPEIASIVAGPINVTLATS